MEYWPQLGHMKMIAQFGSGPKNDWELRTLLQFLHKIDWFNLTFTGAIPVVAFVVGILCVPLKPQTAVFTAIFAVCSGISITAGEYHS
jgi:hypothetical protein